MAKKFVVIEEFPNYSINRDGAVINNKTKRIMSIFMSHGSKSVRLCKNGVGYNRCINKLVAIAFPTKTMKKTVTNTAAKKKLITIEQIMDNCKTKYVGTKAKKLLSNFFYGIGPKTQKELIRAINISAN